MSSKSNPSVLRRFHGKIGKKHLDELFTAMPLFAGVPAAAIAIRKCVVLSNVREGVQLIDQGGQDNELYFLISGSVRIIVNGRQVSERRTGEYIGEMTLLDRTAVRSASAITCEPSVIAKISERDFTQVSDRYPSLWRKLAVTLAQRLRERNRFHQAPRSVPVVFIGSSSENLDVAVSIQTSLQRRGIETRLWSEGVFQCTRSTIEDLINAASNTDFAVLVLTPDDLLTSRGKQRPAPRDNVVFELGLFMGAIGRDRTYIVASKQTDIKMPTDLLGVTFVRYSKKRDQSLGRALQSVMRELSGLITRYGPK